MVFAPLSLPDTCHDELRYGYVIRYTSWFSAGVHDGRSMSCEEKTRLTARYEAATTRFCEAVTELNQKMGTSAKAEYDHLARVANELRLNSEQVRASAWAAPRRSSLLNRLIYQSDEAWSHGATELAPSKWHALRFRSAFEAGFGRV